MCEFFSLWKPDISPAQLLLGNDWSEWTRVTGAAPGQHKEPQGEGAQVSLGDSGDSRSWEACLLPPPRAAVNGQSPLWFFVFPGGELGLRPRGQPALPVPAPLSARGLQSRYQGDVLDLEPGTARVLSACPRTDPCSPPLLLYQAPRGSEPLPPCGTASLKAAPQTGQGGGGSEHSLPPSPHPCSG